jgi:nitrite reductase/ring-hydroxylating ferredoxin subunit
VPLVRLPQPPAERLAATWQQADLARITAALEAAEARTTGGWHVVAAATAIRRGTSLVRTVAGRELVLWRADDGALYAGPGACPHMGASLEGCPVSGSTLRCKWHGLAFTPNGRPDWQPVRAHDDGVLAWVQLPGDDAPTDAPVLPPRPPSAQSVSAVITVDGRCEPRDVIANRLDPWHGAWLHPYAFSHLTVDEDASDTHRLVVDVAFRLGRRYGVPVRAVFFCPDARTIVMQIVDGEGAGSVVETHATLLRHEADGTPVTQVTEATIAHSDRSGFRVATRLAALIRPAMRHTARQLWVDDLAYAERRYLVRTGSPA